MKAPRRGIGSTSFFSCKRGGEGEDAGGGGGAARDDGGQGRFSCWHLQPRLWFWMTKGRQQLREAEGPALREPLPPASGDWSHPEHRTEVQRDQRCRQFPSDPVLRAGEARPPWDKEGEDRRRLQTQQRGQGPSPSCGPIRSVPHCWHGPAHGSHGHCPPAGNGSHREWGRGASGWPGRCPGRCRRQACR